MKMGWDNQIRDLKAIDHWQVHVHSGNRMGWDNQMRNLKTIDQVHVRSGDG